MQDLGSKKLEKQIIELIAAKTIPMEIPDPNNPNALPREILVKASDSQLWQNSKAEEYFNRDLKGIRNFFRKKFLVQFEENDIPFEEISNKRI